MDIETVLILMLLLLIVIGAIIFGVWFMFGRGGKKKGEACSLHTDCEGWGPGPTAIACCNGVCMHKVKDWAGVGYCPDECRGAPAAAAGTCGEHDWPRKEGQPCNLHTDCEGHGPGANDMACCKGKCVRKVKDWAGVGYCPHVCRGSPGGAQGTCGDYNWPRKQGQPCNLHTDCEGHGPKATDVACCNGKCTKKVKDWAGVGYCPDECVGSPGGKKGTCGQYSWPRAAGEPCNLHTDCKGWGAGATDMACCQGKCTRKKKDWAGVGYCPHECVGKIGGSKGSC